MNVTHVSTGLPARRLGVAAVLLLTLGSACTGSVTVERLFPAPLIERLPLRVALHYAPALTSYVYSEASVAEKDWTVNLGQANVRMFDSVFASLFAVTQRVTDVSAASQEFPGLDATIAPSVDKFEFSLPSQSATDQYAVWIRYNLDVYGPDGQLIFRWPVSAYGQSGTGGLSAAKAMERATVLALRDAAATIAVDFAKQPEVRESLLKETPAESPKEKHGDGP